MRHEIWTALMAAAVLFGGCAALQPPREDVTYLQITQALVPPLTPVLVGSFSSAAQAAADPEHYFDIRLHAVEIWQARGDGPWLYVEQAAATALDKPYRQRIYRLSRTDSEGWRSDVFTLADPLRFAGWWRTPERFDRALSPSKLEPRDGCSIELRYDWNTDAFVGGTSGTGCASDLRGAAYATSEVELFPDRLLTWDRGFDAAGHQVWGATLGPYRFDRVPEPVNQPGN